MSDFQRDSESRFGGTRFNLKPVTQDPIYPKDGDSWFRVDQGIIKLQLAGIIYGMALVDNSTGKLIGSQFPTITINQVFIVNSQVAMLALSANIGDVAVRTDESLSYILVSTPPSIFGNWTVLSSVTATVSSVNGQIGVVNLSTTDIPEGSNLYYTNARFDTRFSSKSTTNLAEGTNLYYTQARFNSAFSGKTTSDLTEGGNLYYTQARFDTSLATKSTTNLSEGTNLYYTQARFDTAFSAKSTTNLSEGTNLYYTNTRFIADFDTRLATKSTTNLSEGINLYYTQARFDTAFSAKSTTNLSEGTNLYFTNARADARISAQKGVANGIATLDGSGTIPASQLPGEATIDTNIVVSQIAMLALSAQKGDIAKRTDTKEIYILRAIPASTLSNWELLSSDYNANVDSVNGFTRTVSLTTSDVAEGTNLYYTNTRFIADFDTRLATKSTTNLSEGINLYYTQARFDTAFSAKSTTNLSEGTNLYYTQARFDTAFSGKSTTNLSEGTNLYYTDARFDTRFSVKSTSDLAEGTNLYYTTARANSDFDTRLATKTTTSLAEGTNLYYTDARADARISAQKGVANGIATLDSGGKIPSGQLPAIAITDTFVVASQVAMLALTVQTGDVAVRTDLNKSFILRGTDPTVLGDWQELLTPTDSVLSVNSQTGAVVLTTTNINEGTNLYYTTARQNTDFDTRLATKSTTNLSEGTNLYYTQARFDTAFSAKTTTNLSEGTNLYYTTARQNTDFDTRLATKSTTNLSEGTNLYFTNARARSAISATTPIAYDSSTGIISLNTVPINKGGTNNTSYITGSVPYFDGTKLNEDNSKLFYDGTNHRLGIGTSSPNATLDLNGDKAERMVTLSQITSNQNDYSLGLGTIFRLTSDVNNRAITGLTGGYDGRIVTLINVNSSNFNIVINNQNAGSIASNRFQNSTNANINLSRFSSITYIYDATTQVWRDI